MEITIENFTKRFGDLTVIDKMNLKIFEGEMLALLGPSGCGKSTTLFTICGILRADAGRILFGNTDVSDVPAQMRNVGVVFQSYALYPHMSVSENIAFPLKVKKESKQIIQQKVREIAELVHIEELLERRPEQLGGQQQRVALARALIRKPNILLLDEPLANLDAKLRLEMRSEIRRIQLETGISAVLVTHDQVEAMSMCDRIAIMNEGKILQVTTPSEMYENPTNDFVASFLGNPPIVFLDAEINNKKIIIVKGSIKFDAPEKLASKVKNSKIRLGIRPEYFQPNNPIKLPGTVTFVETQGREYLYDVKLDDEQYFEIHTIISFKKSEQDNQINWGLIQRLFFILIVMVIEYE